MRILVTGGCGFIGSNFVLLALESGHTVANLDKLTYAGVPFSLREIETSENYSFFSGDVADYKTVKELLGDFRPEAILHLAAESHVDRSIDAPGEFIRTNVTGTFQLLEAAKNFFETLSPTEKDRFRFVHVSTDEVFGSLGSKGQFTENTAYSPRSPYSASKAASDHLARAYFHTYGLPVIVTNCSNNYGPRQFPEKLIPLVIRRALEGLPIPVYGDGLNVRDWLYVEDHCRALHDVIEKGLPGETYAIGGNSEKTTIDIVYAICDILDELQPLSKGTGYRDQIQFVQDRPGHDRRYAIDPTKIRTLLGWRPRETFESGIRKTVCWYIDNGEWIEKALGGGYQMERLGLGLADRGTRS